MRKLSFHIRKTDVSALKIDSSRLEIFDIVIAFFWIDNKNGKSCFFKRTFLLADISINITFGMFFLILSNVKDNFTDQKLK